MSNDAEGWSASMEECLVRHASFSADCRVPQDRCQLGRLCLHPFLLCSALHSYHKRALVLEGALEHEGPVIVAALLDPVPQGVGAPRQQAVHRRRLACASGGKGWGG